MIINCVGAGSYRSDPTNSDNPAPFDDPNRSIAPYSELRNNLLRQQYYKKGYVLGRLLPNTLINQFDKPR